MNKNLSNCVLEEINFYQIDRCREDCEPFKMEGACGAYWECENGVSVPKCCPPSFAFVSGVGCQLDFRCKDMCQAEKWCGECCLSVQKTCFTVLQFYPFLAGLGFTK